LWFLAHLGLTSCTRGSLAHLRLTSCTRRSLADLGLTSCTRRSLAHLWLSGRALRSLACLGLLTRALIHGILCGPSSWHAWHRLLLEPIGAPTRSRCWWPLTSCNRASRGISRSTHLLRLACRNRSSRPDWCCTSCSKRALLLLLLLYLWSLLRGHGSCSYLHGSRCHLSSRSSGHARSHRSLGSVSH